MSTILSSAQLIAKYKKTDEQKNRERHIKRIESTIDNLNGTLNEILCCKELDNDKIICNAEEFNLRDLILDIIDESKFAYNEKVEVLYKHEGFNTNIISDRTIIKNIIENLVTNAIKYSNKKTVEINSCLMGDKIILNVKDNGIGIPFKEQSHIFRRFYKASNANGSNGTGVGLSIVKKYVDKLNGHIQLISEVGKGTEFIISVPAIIIPLVQSQIS